MGPQAADGLPASRSGHGPSVLISAGFSGGLTDAGRTGDIILAESIDHAGTQVAIDAELLQRAKTALQTADRRLASGSTICVDQVVAGPDEKQALGKTGTLSVDMESGPLARWAEEHAVPFLSLRVILDPVDAALPFSNSLPIWRSALRHPLAMIRIGRMARIAGRTLGTALNDVVDVLEELP